MSSDCISTSPAGLLSALFQQMRVQGRSPRGLPVTRTCRLQDQPLGLGHHCPPPRACGSSITPAEHHLPVVALAPAPANYAKHRACTPLACLRA